MRSRISGARRLQVHAKKGNPDPPDAPKDDRRGGREWLQTILSRFGPITEKAQNTAVLDFEKPLVELDNRIKEVGDAVSGLISRSKVANRDGLMWHLPGCCRTLI